MYFSYEVSVILLSLALFGSCCFIKELWSWMVQPALLNVPRVSFLVMVRDAEQEIEEMVRHMMMEVELTDIACDIVIVDYGSDDLTYPILERLSREFHLITVLCSDGVPAAARDTLAYCGGEIIYIFDTINRIEPQRLVAVVRWLLKESVSQITMRRA